MGWWIKENRQHLADARYMMEEREYDNNDQGPTKEELEELAEITGAPLDAVLEVDAMVKDYIGEYGYPVPEETGMVDLVRDIAAGVLGADGTPAITNDQIDMALAHMENGPN